jgi:competence protein ComEC
MKKVISSLLAVSLLLGSTAMVSAHPGQTDANGGHTCRTNCAKWGLSDGEYHYHGGKSSSSSSSSSKKSNPSSNSSKKPAPKPAPKPVAKPKPAAAAPVPAKPAPVMQVHYIDVGQGDATYIKTAGGDDILIDGGKNGKGCTQMYFTFVYSLFFDCKIWC